MSENGRAIQTLQWLQNNTKDKATFQIDDQPGAAIDYVQDPRGFQSRQQSGKEQRPSDASYDIEVPDAEDVLNELQFSLLMEKILGNELTVLDEEQKNLLKTCALKYIIKQKNIYKITGEMANCYLGRATNQEIVELSKYVYLQKNDAFKNLFEFIQKKIAVGNVTTVSAAQAGSISAVLVSNASDEPTSQVGNQADKAPRQNEIKTALKIYLNGPKKCILSRAEKNKCLKALDNNIYTLEQLEDLYKLYTANNYTGLSLQLVKYLL